MGSIDAPAIVQNGSTTSADGGGPPPHVSEYGTSSAKPTENDVSRKRKASILPLDVGTRVMCRWRDGKYHPVKVIERRRMHFGGVNDYEYYVHYTECKNLFSFVCFYCHFV